MLISIRPCHNATKWTITVLLFNVKKTTYVIHSTGFVHAMQLWSDPPTVMVAWRGWSGDSIGRPVEEPRNLVEQSLRLLPTYDNTLRHTRNTRIKNDKLFMHPWIFKSRQGMRGMISSSTFSPGYSFYGMLGIIIGMWHKYITDCTRVLVSRCNLAFFFFKLVVKRYMSLSSPLYVVHVQKREKKKRKCKSTAVRN